MSERLICERKMYREQVLNRIFLKFIVSIFISLAYDSDDELKQFLLRKPFNYKVASVQQEFMQNDLSINAYPTHFIIDKTGVIQKVVNSANEMMLELDKSGILNMDETQMRPPPPAF